MNITKAVPHNRLTFGDEELTAVHETLSSGLWAGGKMVEQLEKFCAETANTPFASAVSSGYSAIRLSLLALGIGKGMEVIIPGYSCVALANAVLSTGAMPVPTDIDPETLNITEDTVKTCITKNTAAIIAVHTFGLPAEITSLRGFGVPVIEDCAHCFGIQNQHGRIGSLGDVSILSFYATKLVGGGEGGMVISRNKAICDFVAENRDYTDKPASASRMNEKMHNIEAALSLAQMKRLPKMIAAREEIAQFYQQELAPLVPHKLRLPRQSNSRVWYRYAIRLNRPADEIVQVLRKEEIYTDLPVWDWTTANANLMESKNAYQCILSLPCYPTLNRDEQSRVIQSLYKYLEHGNI